MNWHDFPYYNQQQAEALWRRVYDKKLSLEENVWNYTKVLNKKLRKSYEKKQSTRNISLHANDVHAPDVASFTDTRHEGVAWPVDVTQPARIADLKRALITKCKSIMTRKQHEKLSRSKVHGSHGRRTKV